MKKYLLSVGLIALMLSGYTFGADKVRVGTVPGAFADSIEAVVKDAKKQGIEVEVVEFTDWTTPNIATDNGDIDINYYQHEPHLRNAIAKNGYKLTPIGYGVLPSIGLYSVKHKSVNDVPLKGKVAVVNDPVNQGRELSLIEKTGLIKLKAGERYKATIDDIIENPKQLRFVEVEGVQLVRAISEVDIGINNPGDIVAAGTFNASSGLIYTDKGDRQYAIRFIVSTARKDDPVLNKFVKIYQTSEAVKEALKKGFNNDPRLYTLTWVEDEKDGKETK
jgi:D-methionine transport system substrate-binding protein